MQFQAPQTFARDTLQQRLQAVVEGLEAWTYGIFWQLAKDAASGSPILGFGDGYYKGVPEKEHCELNALTIGDEDEINDNVWSNLVSVMQSVVNGSDVQGLEQQHRKRVFSKLKDVISRCSVKIAADREEVNDSGVPDPAEQQHRKRLLHELNCLISGADPTSIVDSYVEEMEEVTNTEWFFLVSMSRSFLSGSGLPGQALLGAQPIWIANGLAGAPCARAHEAHKLGLRTMVCVPIGDDGVLELGSTDVLFQTTESMAKILSHFNLRIKQEDVPEQQHEHHTAVDRGPDVSS